MSQSVTPSQPKPRARKRPLPGLRIGRFFGVDVHLDPSLLVIFLLIATTLAMGTLPQWHPDWSAPLDWTVALVAAVLFLLSVLVHELSHAVVGRALGIPVDGITLFMFGGMASMGRDAGSPRDEFLMTIVGPLTSLAIGAAGILVGSALAPGDVSTSDPQAYAQSLGPIATIFAWLGPVNVMLAVFNLVPGFPLDGGRVLRAILWWSTADRLKATRWASYVGQGFGLLLIGIGILGALGGGLIGGIWMVLIGWFLMGAAKGSYTQLLKQRTLEGTDVRRLMKNEVPSVSPTMTLNELVEGPAMQTDLASFAVYEGSELVGLIELDQIREVPPQERSQRKVQDVMRSLSSLDAVDADDDADEALRTMAAQDVKQLPVTEAGRLSGFIRQRDILRWLYLQGGTPA